MKDRTSGNASGARLKVRRPPARNSESSVEGEVGTVSGRDGKEEGGKIDGPYNRRDDRRLHPAAVLRIVRQCALSIFFALLAGVRDGCRNSGVFCGTILYLWFAAGEHRADYASRRNWLIGGV